MDEAITQHIKRKYNLLIGERTAELIKSREAGQAWGAWSAYIEPTTLGP